MTEQKSSFNERLIFFIVAAVVIIIDQATKWWVETNIPLGTSFAPFPSISHLFQFTHVPNTGAAFGSFQGEHSSTIISIIATVVGLALIAYAWTLPAGQRLLRFTLGLQLGGAVGNLIDRFRLGWVTDFFDFWKWYIFNIADLAVVSGVCILIYLMWLETKEEMAQKKAEGNA